MCVCVCVCVCLIHQRKFLLKRTISLIHKVEVIVTTKQLLNKARHKINFPQVIRNFHGQNPTHVQILTHVSNLDIID